MMWHFYTSVPEATAFFRMQDSESEGEEGAMDTGVGYIELRSCQHILAESWHVTLPGNQSWIRFFVSSYIVIDRWVKIDR